MMDRTWSGRSIRLLVVLTALGCGEAGAQQLPSRPVLVTVAPKLHDAPWSDITLFRASPMESGLPPNHWLEGGLIGGGVLGVLGSASFVGWCNSGARRGHCAQAAVGGFLLSAALGFGLGAIVGSQFPKH